MTLSGDRSQRRRLLGGDAVEMIVSRAETDVFTGKVGANDPPTERILLAVSGGPHSGLATETARAIALTSDARIDIMHFLSENSTDDERNNGKDILRAAERLLDDVDRVNTDLVGTETVAAEIIARSEEYDVTVLGAPTVGLLRQFVFGTVPDSVTRRAQSAVLMTKHRTEGSSMYYRWIASDAEREVYMDE